jgi:hypothetical protein
MAAREKPHCGVSGVPFMNSTTGAEATALSIAERTSVDRKDFWRAAKRGERRGLRRGRRVWEATCGCVRGAKHLGMADSTDREGGSGEHAGGVHFVWCDGGGRMLRVILVAKCQDLGASQSSPLGVTQMETC